MAIASNLRELAKAYANGQLDKDKYRIDRTSYIEAILAGTVSIRPNQQNASLPPSASTGRARSASEQTSLMSDPVYSPAEDGGVDNNLKSRKTGLIVAGTALVMISIILIVAFTGDTRVQQATQSPLVTDSGTQGVTAPSDSISPPGVLLVRSFLDNNIWSEASMDGFLQDWSALAETDRMASKDSIEIGQMTNAIYKKLLEERALSGIGNPETSYEKQRILVRFASAIGISDPRITLPDQLDSFTP